METLKYCRLIETLKTFSPKEFSDFENIAISPYFSKGRNYSPYIKALKKYYPKFDNTVFHKDNARKHIFELTHPGKNYNDQFMKNIFTDLIHFAEETLFQKVAKDYNHQNLSSLAIEEAKRNLFPLANHNINALDKILDENGIDELYYYCKGMNEIALSILYNKTHSKNHETGKPFTTGVHFIYFSLITLALSIYNSSVRRAMLNLEEDKQFNENFVNLIDLEKLKIVLLNSKDENKEVILIFLYYLIHKSPKSGKRNYEKMRDLTFENYHKFNSRMLFYIISILLSTLYENKNKMEDVKFRKEYHKIVIFSLKNNCYKIMKTATFQFYNFRAYYLNALALGKLEWVIGFAGKYASELLPELQNETLALVNSNILFENKLYDETLEGLKHKCTNILSKIDQRLLKLKIFYHKGSFVQAENSLEALKKFLIKNKVAQHVFRSSFDLFIKFYKKLLNTAEGKEKEPEIILDELKRTSAFPERRWLIESFESIIK